MPDPKDMLPLFPWEGPPIPRALADSIEPATPRQLRYIAILCQKLGMKEPLEEQVRTRGEAGRLIRELEAEVKHRKGLKGGNPKSKYPITWNIYVESPGTDDPRQEDYERLVKYLNKSKLKGHSGPGFIVIEDVPTQAEVDEIKSLVESYNQTVLEVFEIEQVPEEED